MTPSNTAIWKGQTSEQATSQPAASSTATSHRHAHICVAHTIISHIICCHQPASQPESKSPRPPLHNLSNQRSRHLNHLRTCRSDMEELAQAIRRHIPSVGLDHASTPLHQIPHHGTVLANDPSCCVHRTQHLRGQHWLRSRSHQALHLVTAIAELLRLGGGDNYLLILLMQRDVAAG